MVVKMHAPVTDRARGAARFSRRWLPLVSLAAMGLAALFAEICLRLWLNYNPGYYMFISNKQDEIRYPYGVIVINRWGLPDGEFHLDSGKKRIGYFGDSVTYGVGAGYGYRYSEVLEQRFPEFEHMNFGRIGTSIGPQDVDLWLRHIQNFGLQQVIYFFNLNDISPDDPDRGADADTRLFTRISLFARTHLHGLRGKSYLFTVVHNAFAHLMAVRGYGSLGYKEFELFPTEYRSTIVQTAARINAFHRRASELGVEFVLVVLPYEMQISAAAEEMYSKRHVRWEPGFIRRRTQEILLEYLDPGIRSFDAYFAFVDPNDVEPSRARNGLGEYFVFDRGGKLDWNHPTRLGHRAIADFLARQGLFESPSSTP